MRFNIIFDSNNRNQIEKAWEIVGDYSNVSYMEVMSPNFCVDKPRCHIIFEVVKRGNIFSLPITERERDIFIGLYNEGWRLIRPEEEQKETYNRNKGNIVKTKSGRKGVITQVFNDGTMVIEVPASKKNNGELIFTNKDWSVYKSYELSF